MEHRFYSVTNTINNISVDWSLSGTRATLSVAAYARHIYFQLESAV